MLYLRRLRRFLRSPKGYLLVVLGALAVAGAPSTGVAQAAMDVTAAALSAVALDLVWVRLRDGTWRAPSSALLSGLIVALVLSAQAPWYAFAAAAAIAIVSKHLLRIGRPHIFNPAAVGLLAVFFLFGSGQSWWGGLSNLRLIAAIPVLVAGWIVAARANKLPGALSFLGGYVGLFTLAAVTGQSAAVADVFRQPFVGMALFFGFLMVTDPPTSPVPFAAQAVFGAAVAVVSAGAYLLTHGLYFLLAGVLVANLGYALNEAARRLQRSRPGLLWPDAAAGNPRLRLLARSAAPSLLSLLVLVAAAVAIFRPGGSSGAQQPAPAAAAPVAQPAANSAPATTQSAAPGGLAFQDQFTGTVAQQTDATGRGTITIDIAATGERPVQLQIQVQTAQSGRGGQRVQGNQATLTDAAGAQICQGRVTELDNNGFTIRCSGSGGDTALVGTITGGTDEQLQGRLQAAPFGA